MHATASTDDFVDAPRLGPVRRAATNARARQAVDGAAFGILLLAAQQILSPAPLGVIVQGVIVGGLTALIAFGLALIYRANRIVNFSQGDLGAAPASLAVLLIVGPGLNYFIAVPLGIIAGIALGALVEVLIIRRFFKAPRLILMVVTIAMSQLLAGIAIVLPRLFDLRTPPQSFPSPFDWSFTIEPIVFRGNDIIAMLAVPVAIGALAAFFRFTNIGIAVRASAENAERAFLLGVPVKRIQTIVWVLAATLSTLAIFLRAGIVGLPIGSVLGPAILLRALAAAVIGRMEHLPTIFVSAVGIGILEQSILWDTGRSIVTAPVLFVVILVALLVQRRGQQKRADEASSWQAARAFRPIPEELVSLPEIRYGLLAAKAAGLALLVALPMFLSESRINLAALIMIFTIIGLSLVMLTGWAGQISLGQMAFVGLGGAAAGAVTTRLEWDLAFALVVGGVVGAVAAMVIGVPALRIKGPFLAVTTLAFALATSVYLLNPEFFGGILPTGRITRKPFLGLIAVDTEARYYYLTVSGMLLALGCVKSFRASRAGRVVIAVRENERAAQAFGINATRGKLTAFAMSGFLAAFAGGLFIHHQQSLGINPYAPEQSIAVFLMVVIGGLGSVPGAFLGAIYTQGLMYFAPGPLRFFASGLGVLIVLMLIPGGLSQALYQVRDAILRFVADRRGIRVPSLVADSREADELVAVDAADGVPGVGVPAAEVTDELPEVWVREQAAELEEVTR
ncbi:MAG TPA: ABC transporter permease [Acidimicrobiales bacterium]|nr:ABC transporter permease [Acidimicrobiales bacterium]